VKTTKSYIAYCPFPDPNEKGPRFVRKQIE